MFGRKKIGGAIAYYGMKGFCKELSKTEKEAIDKAAHAGINVRSEKIDEGKFSPPNMLDDRDKGFIQAQAIDYFYTIVDNLVRSHPGLAIKLYEHLLKKHSKTKRLFTLYFLHMSGMKAYRKLGQEKKAIKSAEENLKLALKLEKEIKKIGIKANPCCDFLKYKQPDNKLLLKIKKKRIYPNI